MHLSITSGILRDSVPIDNLDRARRSPRSSARVAPFEKKSPVVVIRASNGASISLVRVSAASRADRLAHGKPTERRDRLRRSKFGTANRVVPRFERERARAEASFPSNDRAEMTVQPLQPRSGETSASYEAVLERD
jgi:hypothetical protein